MIHSENILKAVEILCEIVQDIVDAPGTGAQQAVLFAPRLRRLKAGCEALRREDLGNPLARCIAEKDSEGGQQ